MSRRLRLGTRGSRLALIQCGIVKDRLRATGVEVELVIVATEGDERQAGVEIGEGIFVGALERELATGLIDLAVHSAKDLPLKETPGLEIAAYPERADPRDALVTSGRTGSLETLPKGARVGTDSPRRRGFLLAIRPDLDVRPVRGNVDTRLRRLDAGEFDGLVVAAAGLDRLGQGDRIGHRFSSHEVPPAPAQGALAVQCRRGDAPVLALTALLDDQDARLAVEAERALLAATGGDCRSPVGALAAVGDGRLGLVAGAVGPDGGGKELIRLEVAAQWDVVKPAVEAAGRELLEKVVERVG